MIQEASELLPNGRYESATGSSGVGLTFTVTKEPNESFVLRLGAIPLANGSICSINEMNQTPLEQQKHYFDFMEEGRSTNNKYAIPATIIGNTTIIGSANPRGGKWNNPDSDTVELDEIAILPQVMDRNDIICVIKERDSNEAEDWKFIERLEALGKNMETGIYDNYDENLKKYLMYARTFNPDAKVSKEAKNMLYTYWIKMGRTDYRSRIRKLEALFRIAIAISKIKLKDEVDIEDAKETMEFYGVVLVHLGHIVPISESPKEVGRKLFLDFLAERPAYPIAFRELAKVVCELNEQIASYIGDDLSIESNFKLRAIYEALLYSEHVILVQQKPAVFQWKQETKAKASSQASDLSDLSDPIEDRAEVENKHQNERSVPTPGGSDTSDTSDSPFGHLIDDSEYLPTVSRTVFRCKEHPNAGPYYDLKGIEESHFKPVHGP